MAKIVISKKYTGKEKAGIYKKAARNALQGSIPCLYVSPNKKKQYDKKDKGYKSDY